MPVGDKWFKKNQAGYIAQVYFNNGSIIHLMSYDQDVEKFEGVDWDWIKRKVVRKMRLGVLFYLTMVVAGAVAQGSIQEARTLFEPT